MQNDSFGSYFIFPSYICDFVGVTAATLTTIIFSGSILYLRPQKEKKIIRKSKEHMHIKAISWTNVKTTQQLIAIFTL